MIKNKITCCILVFALLAMNFTGCGKEKIKYQDISLDYFDTVTVITGYEKSEAEFKKVVSEVYAILEKCHKQYDIYHSYEGFNNVCDINKQHSAVKVEPETMDMLKFGLYIYEITDGRTNIAMGSVLRPWHEAREYGSENPEEAYLPNMEVLKAAAQHISFDTVIFDDEASTVSITDSEQFLDVGAVAKGYAIELAAEYLEKNGKSGYCLNVGGNVRAVGPKPNGDLWGVGIENPLYEAESKTQSNMYIRIVAFDNMASATSGSYQRFYYVDGVQYHHIIDPDTLMPGDKWVSVSVISPDAGLSDGLSTALFNMTYEDGLRLVESLEEVEALWLTPDGETYESSGFGKYVMKTE